MEVVAYAIGKYEDQSFKPSSPFLQALEILQDQIDYTFKNIDLFQISMTHASFSEENNEALSILGANIMETSAAIHSLEKDIDMSSKELGNLISEISKVSSCAFDGLQLGLQHVVRVSAKTDPSSSTIVCGAFRAMFGAIAIDFGSTGKAGNVFWSIHDGKVERAASRNQPIYVEASPEVKDEDEVSPEVKDADEL
ncbi:hypothetical protein CCACVL1_08770 [Corchorus capsularis]|uniref:RNase III domain-containing protein n=1 Tax=Corchorus capsularis TaxID=210143 RepID=A0A1R3IYY5_COCAP|nr:hypothetical protein CCACVL1_08770 [Corchorus capsularis]